MLKTPQLLSDRPDEPDSNTEEGSALTDSGSAADRAGSRNSGTGATHSERRNSGNSSDHSERRDSAIDVVGDILDAVHLTTDIFGRLELGAPWRVRWPARPQLSFYVVARGGGWIELDGGGHGNGHAGGPPQSVPLSAGDAILLPHGSAHSMVDTPGSPARAHDIDFAACQRPWIDSARLGEDGPVTSIVTGHFTFGGSASRNPLLASLPALVHVPAHASAENPQLAGVVPLILNEAARPGPGATIVLARLADLLLIHALRYWIATAGAESCGLRAVSDSTIGAALRLMHARFGEPWTVESLAAAVALSRSAFAARFTQLVGEPPLQYLARWRMTKAALLLSTSEQSVAAIADKVGYANPVAFSKAFARFQGIGPGAYRRAHRPATAG